MVSMKRSISDNECLKAVADMMSGKEWNAGMLDLIADLLRGTGRSIVDIDDLPRTYRPQPWRYRAQPDGHGKWAIAQSIAGCNWEVIDTGILKMNVHKMINKLHKENQR